MNYLLDKILSRATLNEEEAILLIEAIDKDLLTAEQISGILIGIQMRGLQIEEIKGFKKALLALSLPVSLPFDNAVDLCGTGGDNKDTFNISTTTSLVLAAMGYKVLKHGNYGVSSICGSSNVLEELGFELTTDASKLEKSFNEKNIAFLHAPLFHPTLKKVGQIRKNLGVRTLFNVMGPLVNPAQPAYQLTGTFSLELALTYQHVLKNQRKAFKIVHGLDGYDEMTLTDETRVLSQNNDCVKNAHSFGLERINAIELNGGVTIREAAKIVRDIATGNGSKAQNTVIAANVTEVITMQTTYNSQETFSEVQSFIKSGQTAKHFNLSI
ncbi:MAG: anthranilate phosphoribosyltransferase [Bacteroidetes bacterium]|nr:anthranilate phosphoribosyltransferase [Bacteroidota bacterium]